MSDLVKRLHLLPLYESHGKESDAPEEAAIRDLGVDKVEDEE